MDANMKVVRKGNHVTIDFDVVAEKDAPLSSTGKMKLGMSSGFVKLEGTERCNVLYGYALPKA